MKAELHATLMVYGASPMAAIAPMGKSYPSNRAAIMAFLETSAVVEADGAEAFSEWGRGFLDNLVAFE
jgi:hypothetical protein